MGMTIDKMYGSYSDSDLNDWERFPIPSNVLTSSAFGAWLLRRDERRDTTIKADYEKRLKADKVAMLTDIQSEFKEGLRCRGCCNNCVNACEDIPAGWFLDFIDAKINSLKESTDGME